MATIEKRGDSYRIIVSSGYDAAGRQIRHTKTYKPDPGMTNRQIEKAVQRAVSDFEREVEQGYQLDSGQRFADYAEYVIKLKAAAGLAPRTLDGYRDLLPRINAGIGHMKLSEIRPQHLNQFYANLLEHGIRASSAKAVAKPGLAAKRLKAMHMTRSELSRQTGVSAPTVSAALNGHSVLKTTAEKIAAALGMDTKSLFNDVPAGDTLSTKYILEHHHFISAVLNQAKKELLVPYNAASLSSPPKARRPAVNYYQPATVHNVLEAVKSEPLVWQCFVNLLVATGCRRGELLGLTWQNVSLDLNRVKIEQALLKTKSMGLYIGPTKTADVRVLPIPQQVSDLLRRWETEQAAQAAALGDAWQGTNFVFTRPDGRCIAPGSASQWLTNFGNRHGLPHINAHAFRHSVASILIARGIDVVTVSKQLGHASVNTTEAFYSHLIAEQQSAASRCLTEAFFSDTSTQNQA